MLVLGIFYPSFCHGDQVGVRGGQKIRFGKVELERTERCEAEEGI